MWALRRASLPLRIRGFRARASSAAFPDLGLPVICIQNAGGRIGSPELASYFKGFFGGKHSSANLFLVRRGNSSQTGAESGGKEDEFEDGFSELEMRESAQGVENSRTEDRDEGKLIDEPDLSKDDAESLKFGPEMPYADDDLREKMPSGDREASKLFETIITAPGLSVCSVLDKWVAEGNDVGRIEASFVMKRLLNSRVYGRALQLSQWLEAYEQYEFVENDYSLRLELIARIYGADKARNYIGSVPESFRGELIYRTLLGNYVRIKNVKKAEEVFATMKDLGFPVTVFACNQLLLLYKTSFKERMGDVLSLMEKENIKPSPLTYRILIDAKGKFNDITGMEQILERMRLEGIDLDDFTQILLARHYASAGLKEKAKAVLKQIDAVNFRENRHVVRHLLHIYAILGEVDEVRRVWKDCEPNPWIGEYIAAIHAWGALNRIDEAEAVFEKMMSVVEKPSTVHFLSLLKVYTDHKMLRKGEDLVKLMEHSGCKISLWTWDLLVKLYVGAGEVDKADKMLYEAAEDCRKKPMIRSYMTIMDQYSRRGDIHNTEKMFHRIKEAGYKARNPQYQMLLQAYINAKARAYGMRDRVRADDNIPNKAVAEQLVQVDAFRKSVFDLLD